MGGTKLFFSKHVKGLIKAAWYYSDTVYVVAKNKKSLQFIKTELKKKNLNLRFMLSNTFFKSILEYDTKLFVSIRNGKIIYDPHGIVKIVRRNISKGMILGTYESLFKKFVIIQNHVKAAEQKKEKILHNLYMAVVDCSQAALLMKGHQIIIPRLIPNNLEKHFLGEGLEKTNIKFCREIIQTYKNYEHGKISLPSGKELDELIHKAETFRNAIKMIL